MNTFNPGKSFGMFLEYKSDVRQEAAFCEFPTDHGKKKKNRERLIEKILSKS